MNVRESLFSVALSFHGVHINIVIFGIKEIKMNLFDVFFIVTVAFFKLLSNKSYDFD